MLLLAGLLLNQRFEAFMFWMNERKKMAIAQEKEIQKRVKKEAAKIFQML